MAFPTNALYRPPSFAYGAYPDPSLAYGAYPDPILYQEGQRRAALEMAARAAMPTTWYWDGTAYRQPAAYPPPAPPRPASLTQQLYIPTAQEPSDPKVKNLQILDNVLQSDRPTKKLFRNYLRTICKTRGIRLPGRSSNYTTFRGLRSIGLQGLRI